MTTVADDTFLSEATGLCGLDPPAQLCFYCRAIPLQDPSSTASSSQSSPKSDASQYISHYSSFLQLQESADAGCNLCRHIWTTIIIGWRYPASNASESLLSMRFKKVHQELWRLFIDVKCQGSQIYGPFFVDFKVGQYEQIKELHVTQPQIIKCLTRDEFFTDLEDLIKTQIRPWIRSCREHHAGHELCDRGRPTKVLPTRLLDVGQYHDYDVKIVMPEDSADTIEYPYLILSYCWGTGNQASKTTLANLQERLSGFKMSSLPQTLQDAIFLTRMIGFRYLWIDAICIVQGAGAEDSGDFEKEAVKMRHYYANAECCISASLASDSSHGFLRERLVGRFPLQRLLLTHSTSLPPGPQSWVVEVTSHRRRQRELIINSPLMKRGWYFQELLLSSRILHWTAHGLFMQCPSGYFPEGTSQRWPALFEADRKHPASWHTALYYDPWKVLAVPDEELLASNGWPILVSRFSEMALTYPQDRLYAISGIARLISERLNVKYFNGVFQSCLAQGLGWWADEFVGGPRQPGFPTWCWASSGQVVFESVPDGLALLRPTPSQPFPSHDEKIEPKTSQSRIYVTAPLINATLTIEKSATKLQRCRIDAHTACPQEFDCRVKLDNTLKEESESDVAPETFWDFWEDDQDALVQVLLLSEARPGDDDGKHVGLLVQKMSDREEPVYQRYAMIKISTRGVRIGDSYRDCITDVALE